MLQTNSRWLKCTRLSHQGNPAEPEVGGTHATSQSGCPGMPSNVPFLQVLRMMPGVGGSNFKKMIYHPQYSIQVDMKKKQKVGTFLMSIFVYIILNSNMGFLDQGR